MSKKPINCAMTKVSEEKNGGCGRLESWQKQIEGINNKKMKTQLDLRERD
jgi:hypothetical protein